MDPVRLMTWNVRYFGHGLRGLRATRGGMRASARALAGLAALPDLVALQEVETSSLRAGLHPDGQLARFLGELHGALDAVGRRGVRYRGLYYPAHRYGGARGPALYTTGLAILVGPRLEIVDHNAHDPDEITHVRVPWTRGLKQRRIVAHARVRLRDAPATALDLFNTHLSLPAFFEVGPHRVHAAMGQGSNQVAEVQAVLDALGRRADGPAVLVGDLNTAPGSPAYDAVLSHGLVDVFAARSGLSDAERAAVATAGFARARMHIDHIFGDPSLPWIDAHAHRVDGGPFARLSDHAPKLATVDLAGARPRRG